MDTNQNSAPQAQEPVSQQNTAAQQPVQPPAEQQNLKFCKHCGAQIHADAIICTVCGRQVEELPGNNVNSNPQQPNIVINNSSQSTAAASATAVAAGGMGKPKNKWVAFVLCLLLGFFGAHKFYEGKVGMGILYIFTFGLCFIGVIIDLIVILTKPNPYYV